MLSTTMKFELAPIDNHTDYLYDAVDVYCKVWNRNPSDSMTFFKKYTRMDNFIGYVALVETQVVGFALGTISETGQWWHDKVRKHVGKNHPALQDAWVLTELAVLQSYRKHNIGSILHDRVLREQPHPDVLLSTQVDNIVARRFYEKRDWHYLHQGFAFLKGSQQYCIMHKAVSHGC